MGGKDLFGREGEMIAARNAIHEGLRGNGRVTLILGETGVGKTALVEHCLSMEDCLVIRGRAWEQSAASHGPLAEAMREALRLDPRLAKRLGAQRAMLPLFLPELGTPPAVEDDSVALGVATALFIAAAKHRPVALLLEDLQWADGTTLDLIPRLATRLCDTPVAVIGTHRTEGLGRSHPLRRARAEIRRGVGLCEVQLHPLDSENSSGLLERVLGGRVCPELRDLMHQRTHGIPLYIEELASAMKRTDLLQESEQGLCFEGSAQPPLPESIRDLVALRLDDLSSDAHATLDVAAVLGGDFSFAALDRLGGDASHLAELFDSALLVEEGPGRASFRHALTREVVLEGIPWSRRRLLHRSAADLLEAEGAAPEMIADHLMAANDPEPARRWLIRAADRMCRVHAHRDAVRMASRALEIWPEGQAEEERLNVLRRMAQCAQSSGLLREAVRALSEFLEASATEKSHPRRAEVLSALATVHALQEQWDRSIRVRRESAEAHESCGLLHGATREWLQLAQRLMTSMRLDEMLESATRAVTLARRVEDLELIALSIAAQAAAETLLGHAELGRKLAREALDIALANNLVTAGAEIYRLNAFVMEYCAEYDRAWSTLQTVRSHCAAHGQRGTADQCLGCMAWIQYRMGDWRQALDICQEILRGESITQDIVMTGHCVKAVINAERGEFRSALRHCQMANRMIAKVSCEFLRIYPICAQAIVAMGEKRWEAADQHFGEVLECGTRISDWYGVVAAMPAAMIFWADKGDEARLAESGDALSRIAAQTGNPEAQAALALALGEITMLRGDWEVANRHFEQASSRFHQLSLPLEHLRSEMRLGIALHRWGRTEDGASRLVGAMNQARRLGMRSLAAQITRALEEVKRPLANASHGDCDGGGVATGITPRQREVLSCLAEGLTNKEIASRLHISARTVDMHMRHLFDRLNVRSRTEALRRASETGISA